MTGGVTGGTTPEIEPGRAAAIAARLAPDLVTSDALERAITVDQTNYSVVVGEAVVVKWLVPAVPAPYGAVEQLAHLGDVGFSEMPPFYGAQYDGDEVTAMVTGYIAGALDGWEWYVDDLTAALRAGDIADVVATAADLGGVAARLAVAFATPSRISPKPVVAQSVGDEATRGRALLDEALAVTPGEPGRRLAARADRVRLAIDALATAPVDTHWVHGDLHVGQMLRSPTTMVVNDFDGSPVMPVGQRHGRRTPMVDLASMLQSIDHVARIVVNRHPELTDAAADFLHRALPAALTQYRSIRPLSDDEERLLPGLRAIQELHEFVYAARNLPRWLYVPDAALQAMFPN
jgi:maltokinase